MKHEQPSPKTTIAASFRSAARFRVWFVPLLIVGILVVGFWAHTRLEESVKNRLGSGLEVLLNAEVAALEVWHDKQRVTARLAAEVAPVRRLVLAVAAIEGADRSAARLLASQELADLREFLDPILEERGYAGFVVTDPTGLNIAATEDDSVGRRTLYKREDFLERVLEDDEVVVTRPFPAHAELLDAQGVPRRGWPTMFASAPVYDDDDRAIAAISLRIRPETEFTGILSVVRLADSGETYAFDEQGVMLSESRFENQLRQIGLLAADAETTFNVRLRDPGGNLLKGFRPPGDDKLLLTRMAESAVAGESGVDVDGYRDYRGVEVVGAWTWLDKYGFGVATELDHDEAMRIPNRLRLLVWSLVGLIAVAGAVVLGVTGAVSRISRTADRAVKEARLMGQYTLEERLGEGGMGEVYRASHSLLRRPTAIKLLKPERTQKEDIARFEREVQMTSQLTHPNTIVIFDYGKSADGLFYYAMEYLPGINLHRLVMIDGPQPAGRVIHIMRQVCGSLAEAHRAGMIHRDIKPANIIICERGGLHDVAKVVDFGIVKSIGAGPDEQLTAADALTGTPLYMSPEQIRTPDALNPRSDLYSLGAVGYFLLTGKPVFEGDSAIDICSRHLNEPPKRPSERLGAPVPDDLTAVIMNCLEKDRGRRPRNANELAGRLDACADAATWHEQDADAWWNTHADRLGLDGGSRRADVEMETLIVGRWQPDATETARTDA